MADPRLQEVFQRLEELERRVSQMVVRGKIHSVDPDKAVARVEYGPNLVTGWLHWKPLRTGKAVVWWVPEVGEGVTVISDGDLSLGEIIPGSYQDDYPAPSNDPDLFHVNFGNGTVIEYHRTEERFSASIVGDLSLSVSGSADVTTEGDTAVNVGGDATVEVGGNLTANAGGNADVTATKITMNGGAGVVTGAHKCLVLGVPHADCSSTVCAGK